ncbi:MAG: DUF748 domain-containing protein [Myxococcales bacterium]|nr:DUF748 domain-containing protein [Myxococcales bacterium]
MLVVLVLLVVAVGALAIFLPGLVASPAVRERIETAAKDATGREFRYQELTFGLLPPRLVITQPRLSGERPDDPPFAEAGDVSLRIALAPLLARALVLENLVVNDATVRLVRDADGLRLPEPPAEEEAAEAPAPAGGDSAAEGGAETGSEAGDSGVALAVEDFRLRGARVILEDRTVTPAATWDVEELDANLKLSAVGPARFDLDARVAGGRLSVDGEADLKAETTDLEAKLEAIGLAALAPYLEAGRTASGTLSGTVGVSGPFARPVVDADLRVADGAVQIEDVSLRGPLVLRAKLAGGEAVSGSFDVDATGAALDAYDGAFQKPAGRPATVKGRLVPASDGSLAVDDVELKIHNLDARGRIDAGKRVRASLTAEPFDLAGWDEILPALAEYRPAGTLSPGALELATEPLSVKGRIGLDGIRMQLPDGPEIAVQGALEGTGDALALRDVVLTTGGESVRVGGQVEGLSRDVMSYRLTLGADGAETNTLLSAFAGLDDQVHGPLTLETDLRGRSDDEKLENLNGRLAFTITPGKLTGVSLLEQTVNRLGTFGEAALMAAALKQPEKAKKLERFYGDEFEELAGTFTVNQGWARTKDLRLVYDGYRVDLAGGLRLFDQKLDFSGQLTLEREVDETLADASGGEVPAETREPRVIQLASVTGTLDDPKVGLAPGTVEDLVGGYARSKYRRKYQDKLDEKLGEGAGAEIGNLVDGLFGGKR